MKTGSPSSPRRSPRTSDRSRARSRSSGAIGTIGTTAAAAIGGCAPSGRRRSIRCRAALTAASNPSSSWCSAPTTVKTDRLWSGSACTSSSRAWVASAAPIASIVARSRPSEKFGTDSSGSIARTLRAGSMRTLDAMSAEPVQTPLYRATFARLMRFLWPYRVSLGVSVLLAIGSQGAALALVWLSGSVVGALPSATHGGDRHQLKVFVGIVILVGAARALMMAGRRLISGRQALGVELDMRNAVYAKLVRLSFRFFDQHQTGQLMSRATVDLQSVRFFLGYGLIFFAQDAFTILGVGIFVVILSWKL